MRHFHVFWSSYSFNQHIEKQKKVTKNERKFMMFACVCHFIYQTTYKPYPNWFCLLIIFPSKQTQKRKRSIPDKVESAHNFFMDSLSDYHNWQHTNERTKYICRKIKTEKKKRIKSDKQRIEIGNEQGKKNRIVYKEWK